MAYFKINDIDYSMYVNNLTIQKTHIYNAQMNAAGDTVVDKTSAKRTIIVGIIPINDTVMAQLLQDIDAFAVSISFRNPQTNQLEENVPCIIPASNVSYYTIQVDKVLYNALTLTFTEL